MNKKVLIVFLILVFSFVLAGCGSSDDTPEANDPAVLLTAAVQTADAQIRTMAAATPTGLPTTPAPPTVTPTATATLTLMPGVPTQGSTGPAGERVEFVADLTVPDGTIFAPNATFVKTWRLKNAGTTTWTNAYTMIYSSGDQMGAPVSVVLPGTVAPGQTVDLSVNMIAPAKEGTYTANFLLANANGARFGLDPSAIQPFYVVIVVSADGGTPALTPTSVTPTTGATTTPGTGGSIVTLVFLSVDNANASGCPHSYNFTGQITLNNPATITYQFEVFANTTVPTPAPVTATLPAGTHNVTYSLSVAQAFSGVARLHVTAPEDIYSNPVNLALSCPYP